MIDIRKYEGKIRSTILGLSQDKDLCIEFHLMNHHGLSDRTLNISGTIREEPSGELLGALNGTGKTTKNHEASFFDINCDFEITVFLKNKISCNSYLFGSKQGLSGQLNIGDTETKIKLTYKGIQTDPY